MEFELERERSLGDVLYSLDQWLDGQGLIISRVEMDGRSVGESLDEVSGKSVDSILSLNIGVERISLFRAEALRTAIGWLERLRSGNPEGILDEGKTVLSSSSGFLNPEETSVFELALEAYAHPETNDSGKAAEAAAQFLSERLSECENPRAQALKAVADFRHRRESILDIPVWLQTGRDREAMEAISRFTDDFSRLLRLIPVLVESGTCQSSLAIEGKPYGEFFAELNGTLTELAKAFESRDTVLIGDLSEYEVLPRLDSIFAALEKAIS